MTPQQIAENVVIEKINYELNKILIDQKVIITHVKNQPLANVLKHHQAMLNLDYAYEITQRAIEQLTAAKHK